MKMKTLAVTILFLAAVLNPALRAKAPEAIDKNSWSYRCAHSITFLAAVGVTLTWSGFTYHQLSKYADRVQMQNYLQFHSPNSKYTPETPALSKYAEICRIFETSTQFLRDSSFVRAAGEKVGIFKNDSNRNTQQEILRWISANDPDPKARSLARIFLTAFESSDPSANYRAVTAVLGTTVPDYVPGGRPSQNLDALQAAVARGLTPEQRLGLHAIEIAEKDKGEDSKTAAKLLRLAPGFLDGHTHRFQTLNEWIDKAIENAEPGDVKLAAATAETSFLLESRLKPLLARLGPKALVPFFRAEGWGLDEIGALIEENSGSYLPEVKRVLEEKDGGREKSRLLTALATHPNSAKPLKETLVKLLEYPDRDIQGKAISLLEDAKLLDPADIVKRLKETAPTNIEEGTDSPLSKYHVIYRMIYLRIGSLDRQSTLQILELLKKNNAEFLNQNGGSKQNVQQMIERLEERRDALDKMDRKW